MGKSPFLEPIFEATLAGDLQLLLLRTAADSAATALLVLRGPKQGEFVKICQKLDHISGVGNCPILGILDITL